MINNKCPTCNSVNEIVNACGCDLNNLPTEPLFRDEVEPMNEHARRLWRECRSTIANPDCCGQTKMMAIFIKQQLELEERCEQRTATLYQIKEQRDRFQAFCQAVCPEDPKGADSWDYATGIMFANLLQKERKAARDLLDEAASYCPVDVQDRIRLRIAATKELIHDEEPEQLEGFDCRAGFSPS